jgi:hypothetical protein
MHVPHSVFQYRQSKPKGVQKRPPVPVSPPCGAARARGGGGRCQGGAIGGRACAPPASSPRRRICGSGSRGGRPRAVGPRQAPAHPAPARACMPPANLTTSVTSAAGSRSPQATSSADPAPPGRPWPVAACVASAARQTRPVTGMVRGERTYLEGQGGRRRIAAVGLLRRNRRGGGRWREQAGRIRRGRAPGAGAGHKARRARRGAAPGRPPSPLPRPPSPPFTTCP